MQKNTILNECKLRKSRQTTCATKMQINQFEQAQKQAQHATTHKAIKRVQKFMNTE